MLHVDRRPANWAEVYGNREAVSYLKKESKNPKRPHTYLFSGPSGCGKTTMARIYARCLGCNEASLLEYDMGGKGIDFIRELKDTVQFSIMGGGRVKAYLLDEIHYLKSDEAQTGLLKLLEEPPSDTYFLLCTTDPKKLKKTILQRCTKVEVKSLTNEQMKNFIAGSAEAIEFKITAKQIEDIVDKAEGAPRNALVMLEQLQNGYTTEIHNAVEKQAIDLCTGLFNLIGNDKAWKNIAGMIAAMKDNTDPEGVRRAILGYAQWAAINHKQQPAKCYVILDAFSKSVYDTLWPGITSACLAVMFSVTAETD